MTLRPLLTGDTIAFVTPASPLDSVKLDAMTELLTSWGYLVKVFPHAFKRDAYLAGTDAERATDLMAAFNDDSVAAVMCNRGGYGCARLLEYLDLDRMAETRKMLLGFSDVTTLQLALLSRGLPSVYAPMPLTLNTTREPWVYQSLRQVLTGNLNIPTDAPRGVTVVPGSAEGMVTGGCLCLIGDSIGTSHSINAEGRIVIIEDVDENPHRVDAMLTHLRNAGIIQQAAGIVVGEMTGTDERVDAGIGGKPWREIFRDRLGGLGIPMITDYPFGHAKNMLTLPMGIRARLDADMGTLTYLESLCS